MSAGPTRQRLSYLPVEVGDSVLFSDLITASRSD